MSPLKYILSVTPKSLLSLATGKVSRVKFPGVLQKKINSKFVSTFQIDLSEAAHRLDDFESIEDLFTRELKPGARKVAVADIVSPADGMLVKSLPIHNGEAIQAKGISYSAEQLVFGDQASPSTFDPAWFQTVYLAPHNYHRVHSPVEGRLTAIRHIPGKLWPVNEQFVGLIPKLFTTNERMVFDIETKSGGKVYVAMVGALNVGRIATKHCLDLVTNTTSRQVRPTQREIVFSDSKITIQKGEELGVFMLGSTAVVVFDRKTQGIDRLKIVDSAQVVHYGQSLIQ
ncbi:MAG: archaetidylserine decarboxylase [Pseudomonadota bacterium]